MEIQKAERVFWMWYLRNGSKYTATVCRRTVDSRTIIDILDSRNSSLGFY
ncbi:hypothetical protein [Anaerobium acetethylicum]|nr:hypothetical protein [Anaerobium acetethylicum]